MNTCLLLNCVHVRITEPSYPLWLHADKAMVVMTALCLHLDFGGHQQRDITNYDFSRKAGLPLHDWIFIFCSQPIDQLLDDFSLISEDQVVKHCY